MLNITEKNRRGRVPAGEVSNASDTGIFAGRRNKSTRSTERTRGTEKGGMDQGDGYQTVSALGVGQKKIRNAVRGNECGAVRYAVDRKDVHKRRDDERDFRKQTEVSKVIFREWVITMKGVACAYRIYKKGRYIGTFQATGVEAVTGIPKGRVNRYAREKKHYKGMYLFEIAGDAKKA